MAHTDAIVLGAGIVGTSIALHLAKRGSAVALVDRGGPGEETSYGNAGVIEGDTVFPPAFPSNLATLIRVGLKRATQANYHLSFLPRVAPWLLAFRKFSRLDRLAETARAMRPLFARAIAEHEMLLAESGADRYLRREGWLRLYRTEGGFAALRLELDLAREFGIPFQPLDVDGARAARAGTPTGVPPCGALAGSRQPDQSARGDPRLCGAALGARRHIAHRRRPLAAPRTAATGGSTPRKARSMRATSSSRSAPGRPTCSRRSASSCRSASSAAITAISARPAMPGSRARWSIPRSAIAARRWSRGSGSPPARNSPHRDAPATPVQFDRIMPYAKKLFPLGEAVEARTLARQAAVLSRIRVRSSAALPAKPGCGSPMGTPIGA